MESARTDGNAITGVRLATSRLRAGLLQLFVGNIAESPIGELVGSRSQYEFGQDKTDSLPKYCLDCDVRFACHGECPKNRFITTPDGEPGLNYLCAGFKSFFHHADRPMQIMVGLMRRERPASEVMAILAKDDPPGTAPAPITRSV